MNIFNHEIIWLFIGILLVIILMAVKAWSEDRGRPVRLWQYPVITLWLIFFGLGCAFVGTSIGEGEKTAALLGGLLFAFLALVSATVIYRFILAPSAKSVSNIDQKADE